MTRFVGMIMGAILLALIFNIGIVCAVDGNETQADLNVSKVVSSTGPYEINDEVTWVVTVWNNGPGNATNITITEDISHLAGLKNITAGVGLGRYNTTTNIWTIDELKNASYTTLTLKTTFNTSGNKINKVTISALNETDPIVNNNHAEATIQINASDIIKPQRPQADLNVSKVVSSTGPYEIDDEVTWVVTVWNNGPGNATNITIADDISHLTGLKNITAVAGHGRYNTTTNIWNIDELKNASYTTLTLKTTFNTSGDKINKVDITALNETDPILNNNHAEATVRFNASGNITPDSRVSANLVIKPTTLNLKSKGVFTVHVSLTGAGLKPAADERKKPRIDYANSSLTCSEAELVRATASGKDGGTLIAKFYRKDLENVTPGEGIQINCSGTLAVNGMIIPVEGSDTIRVIGEKKGLDKVLSRLWKFLGIEKDDVEITEGEDGNITVTLSLNPDSFKNPGQAKKILKINNNESETTAGNETAVSDQPRGGKEKNSKNNGDNKIREKNADDKPDKGNKGSDKQDDEAPGKSNGKRISDKAM
jgi:uncharacterized repeat protein (TIGR01451 family)